MEKCKSIRKVESQQMKNWKSQKLWKNCRDIENRKSEFFILKIGNMKI